MKNIKMVLIILISFLFVVNISCTKDKANKEVISLNDQLTNLENIIKKYEPKFKSIEYGSPDYNEMVLVYNKEIKDWAAIFEENRYEKDQNGKMIPKQEFKDVEKRFYELNNRMTRMVLATMPKIEKPATEDMENTNAE